VETQSVYHQAKRIPKLITYTQVELWKAHPRKSRHGSLTMPSRWPTSSEVSTGMISRLSWLINFCQTWTRYGKSERRNRSRESSRSIRMRSRSWRGNSSLDSHTILCRPRRPSQGWRTSWITQSRSWARIRCKRRRTRKPQSVSSLSTIRSKSSPKCSNRRKSCKLKMMIWKAGFRNWNPSSLRASRKRRSTWKEPYGWVKNCQMRLRRSARATNSSCLNTIKEYKSKVLSETPKPVNSVLGNHKTSYYRTMREQLGIIWVIGHKWTTRAHLIGSWKPWSRLDLTYMKSQSQFLRAQYFTWTMPTRH